MDLLLLLLAAPLLVGAADPSCKYNAGYAYDFSYGTYLAYRGDGVNCAATSAPECYWIDHTSAHPVVLFHPHFTLKVLAHVS